MGYGCSLVGLISYTYKLRTIPKITVRLRTNGGNGSSTGKMLTGGDEFFTEGTPMEEKKKHKNCIMSL
ncbi:unnamed protein product [Ilex paraguariensis]|uniref:Uncharacterized protein n=1 Tax=Ilex paraguariensis TaxID=185542 RepID=A0ABC8SQK4_9AQUA